MSESSRPPDRIIMEGMQFYGFHGVNVEERSLGQSYVVDLAVEIDLGVPGRSDRLEDTVSYTHLYRSVQKVLEGESKNLLEATAEAVAGRILEEFPVDAVQVRVKKPRPPIKGSFVENAVVEIYRVRDQNHS
ncbi:MAG: dihydroneopterin aldolase [Chloroflexi bacterium]|nr:dihydroneopterin aldolase [Chloroflexota bacterium]MCH2537082.1 dihydroneopterin aldolase [Dehalococcoidia bacterium]MEE2926140.1 dihydroneopterin aldolase [Chloroflexota bacterium]HIB10534.1 dihydroneopterin aldolase [Dehalococcoidia bacterium]